MLYDNDSQSKIQLLQTSLLLAANPLKMLVFESVFYRMPTNVTLIKYLLAKKMP